MLFKLVEQDSKYMFDGGDINHDYSILSLQFLKEPT